MTMSVTSGDANLDNTIRISGAASLTLPQQTDGPETRTGINEPAAVVSKSLEQLNTAAAESRTANQMTPSARSNGAATLEETANAGLTEQMTEASWVLAERVQTEITTHAEIAVLAQAQQMPSGPMPYSGEA